HAERDHHREAILRCEEGAQPGSDWSLHWHGASIVVDSEIGALKASVTCVLRSTLRPSATLLSVGAVLKRINTEAAVAAVDASSGVASGSVFSVLSALVSLLLGSTT